MSFRKKLLGRARDTQVASIQQQVVQLYEQGRYEQAVPTAIQACEQVRQAVGEENPDYASSLNNLAELYRAMGNYSTAEPLLRQALEICRKAVGESHQLTLTFCINLAELYQLMGKYRAAELLLQEVLEIRRAMFDVQDPRVANALKMLAGLYYAMGKYDAAEPLYKQTLQRARSALGEHHPEVAQELTNLGAVYKSMGNYAAAEPLVRQAMEIRRLALGEDSTEYGQSLNNLASLHTSMGNYAAAEPLFRQALDILGMDHPDYAPILNNLAGLYRAMGNYAESEVLQIEAMVFVREALGEGHPIFAKQLNNLAELYRVMGKYSAAEPLYRRALEIRRNSLRKGHPDVAESLNNLGLFHLISGDYAVATSLLLQALEVYSNELGNENPVVAGVLNNLGASYRAMGDNSTAEPLYRQAFEIRRKSLGEDHPDVAESANNLAVYYASMGDYIAAAPFYVQALEIRRNKFGERHPEVAQTLNNLAELHTAIGNYGAAEQFLCESVEIFREALGARHPSYATSLNNLAILYVATNRASEGIALMQEAAVIDDQMIGQVFSIASESQRMAYLASLQGNFHSFLSLILQHLPDSHEAVQAGLELILRRKGIGAEALAAQRDAVLGGRYPALQPQLKELTILRWQIAQKTLAGPGPEGLEVHERLLVEWTAEKERREEELVQQIPEMNLEQQVRSADRHAVALALPAESALVEFVRFDVIDFDAVLARGEPRWRPAHYLAVVLPAGEPDNVSLIDLGEAQSIEQLIASFRASITGGDRHVTLVETHSTTPANNGADLRHALFDPLLLALAGRTHLFLAPDGDLTRLPFEVLPTSDGLRLIDVYHLNYLSVGRDILRFGAKTSGQSAGSLVAADPYFDLGRSDAPAPGDDARPRGRQSRALDSHALHFNPLPGTHKEGEQIAARLGVSPWLKGAALEGRLKNSPSPRVLHIATHGFFLEDQARDPNQVPLERATFGMVTESPFGRLSHAMENPLLRSGLALAGANTWLEGKPLPEAAEDGILTAEDVSGLDLIGTELVVLSACETGLGKIQVGEGELGLRRAFVLAGAQTLVMSLWKVPDRQTQELMEEFYRRIMEGEGRAESLRAAQLAVKAMHPSPLYWAAFICQGAPGPLR